MGPSHETLKTSAGLPPVRLVRSGDRAFTRRMATASIGLKPMRLAVHRNTTEIQKYIPIVQQTTSAPQHTETMAIYQTTSAPQHTADDFSSTAYSRRLQLHSIQQTTSAPQHSHSIQQSQLSSRQCQLHSIQLHQLSSRLLQLHGIQHTAIPTVQQTMSASQHTADDFSSTAHSR